LIQQTTEQKNNRRPLTCHFVSQSHSRNLNVSEIITVSAGGIRDNWEVVVMLLEPQLMTLASDELFSRDQFEIKPFSSLRSPLVEQLNEAALGELHSPHGPSLFYLESIGHAISGYLLRHHEVTSPLPVGLHGTVVACSTEAGLNLGLNVGVFRKIHRARTAMHHPKAAKF
jgi:hypothetical protein